MKTAWITLGRYGDVLNTLPLVLHDYHQGNNPTMMVSSPWADVIDGVTYCDKLVWHEDYSTPIKAAGWAEKLGLFDRIYVCQCYGTNVDRQCLSFAEEAWRLVGFHHLWNQLPLVFDNRNNKRELELFESLAPKVTPGIPVVLLAHAGMSSPFPHRKELIDLIKSNDKYQVIDISDLKAHRFYDLLGLYESASALVTIDSGPLHLAQATPNLPVIALISDRPDSWHGSPDRSNHALRIPYSNFLSRRDEIVQILENPIRNSQQRLVHVWNDYENRNADASRRHSQAVRSWKPEYNLGHWVSNPVHDSKLSRDCRETGEAKVVPYVNDVIDSAVLTDSITANDLVVLTNDDTIFGEGISQEIINLAKQGPFWCSRMECTRIYGTIPIGERMRAAGAYEHVGADLFAFTKAWWLEHRMEMPLMILSFEAWDLVLRTLINQYGGRKVPALVAHEMHTPYWHQSANRECTGNLFNRKQAQAFFSTRGGWPKI